MRYIPGHKNEFGTPTRGRIFYSKDEQFPCCIEINNRKREPIHVLTEVHDPRPGFESVTHKVKNNIRHDFVAAAHSASGTDKKSACPDYVSWFLYGA